MEVNDGVFFGVSVGGSDFVQLDLFDTLHLHNSTYQGITLGIGVHTLSPGVIFTGEWGALVLTELSGARKLYEVVQDRTKS